MLNQLLMPPMIFVEMRILADEISQVLRKMTLGHSPHTATSFEVRTPNVLISAGSATLVFLSWALWLWACSSSAIVSHKA